MKTICLTGMMGAGKSSVANELARRLGCTYVDIDSLIESSEDTTISNIFREKGEVYFRNLEQEIIKKFFVSENMVIALGGGAFENKATRDFLLKNSNVIYLEVSPNTIFERIKMDSSRPLLKDNMSVIKIGEILSSRVENYKKASYLINVDKLSIEEIVVEILGVLNE